MEVIVEESSITVDSVVVIIASVEVSFSVETSEGSAVVVISGSVAVSAISSLVVPSISACSDVVVGTVSVEAKVVNVDVSMITDDSVVVIIASVEVSVSVEMSEGGAVVVITASVLDSIISPMVVSSISACSDVVVGTVCVEAIVVNVEVSMITVDSSVVVIPSVDAPCSVETPEGCDVVVISASVVVSSISASSDVVAGTVSVEAIVVGIPVKLSSVGSMRDSGGNVVVSRTPSVVVGEASDVISTDVVSVSDSPGIEVVSLVSICGTAVCSDDVSMVDDEIVIGESVVCTGTVVSKLRGDALLVDSVVRSVPLVEVSEVTISVSISRSSG